MSALTSYFDRAFYPELTDNWDDQFFRRAIEAKLTPDSIVLDLGAGAGIVAEMNFRGKVARVCGVDLDPRVCDNPHLDEGLIADGGSIPYDDDTFDVIFADNVMEHIADPAAIYGEVWRTLKPGGIFLFKTPNKTHYMPTIARITPHSFHEFVNNLRGRKEIDTFPTLYRTNTASSIQYWAQRTGFVDCRVRRIEGRPEYLRINSLLYAFGILYERIVNCARLLEPFRILIIAEMKKPQG